MNRFYASCVLAVVAMGSARAELARETIDYEDNGVKLQGYLVYDDALEGPLPGVMVIHEWWGLNDYAKRRADMLAELGYVALACDMYGDARNTDDASEAREWAGQVRGTPLMRTRARAGLDALAAHERVDKRRLAAIGYCFGGTGVLELAYTGAELAGVVSFHGGIVTPAPGELSGIKASILVCHGAEDESVPDTDVLKFVEAMREGGIDWQLVYYSGAVHAFTNPANEERYDATADAFSWEHMKLYLKYVFEGREAVVTTVERAP